MWTFFLESMRDMDERTKTRRYGYSPVRGRYVNTHP